MCTDEFFYITWKFHTRGTKRLFLANLFEGANIALKSPKA